MGGKGRKNDLQSLLQYTVDHYTVLVDTDHLPGDPEPLRLLLQRVQRMKPAERPILAGGRQPIPQTARELLEASGVTFVGDGEQDAVELTGALAAKQGVVVLTCSGETAARLSRVAAVDRVKARWVSLDGWPQPFYAGKEPDAVPPDAQEYYDTKTVERAAARLRGPAAGENPLVPVRVQSAAELPVTGYCNSPFRGSGDGSLQLLELTEYPITIVSFDRVVLLLGRVFRVFTSTQLVAALRAAEVKMDERFVHRRLRRLCEARFLERYQFGGKAGCSSSVVYALGSRGFGLLSNMGVRIDRFTFWQKVMTEQQDKVKKMLSCHQFWLAKGFDAAQIASGLLLRDDAAAENIFGCDVWIDCGREAVIVEGTRDAEDGLAGLQDKLERLNRLVKNGKCPELQSRERVTVVLVAECSEHMARLAGALEPQLHRYRFEVLFCSDEATYLQGQAAPVYRLASENALQRLARRLFSQR